MEKKQTGGMNVGTSSVLVAFVLLCLVTFAGLSFLSANSDYRLSRQTADKTTEYYEAASRADRRLAELDELLAEMADRKDKSGYLKEAYEYFSNDPDMTVSTSGDVTSAGFIVNINERQDLSVTLNLRYPSSDDKRTFEIEDYSVVVNSSWQNETLDEIDENGLMF